MLTRAKATLSVVVFLFISHSCRHQLFKLNFGHSISTSFSSLEGVVNKLCRHTLALIVANSTALLSNIKAKSSSNQYMHFHK